MSAIKSISIPQPCSQSWHQMQERQQGRHCTHCAKTVIDFTVMSNAEILGYLSGKKHVCGRFGAQQLDSLNSALTNGSTRHFSWKGIFAAATLAAVFNMNKVEARSICHRTEQAPIRLKIKSQPAPTLDSTQTFVIRGRVIASDDSLAIPGVSVFIKGTKIGTVTDKEGCFELAVHGEQQVLEVRFIGYEPTEITVSKELSDELSLITLKLYPSFSGEIIMKYPFFKGIYYRYIKRPIHKIFN